MCYSQCNEEFLIPIQCQESNGNEDAKTFDCTGLKQTSTCENAANCGWDTCENVCKEQDTIETDCIFKLQGSFVFFKPMNEIL